MTELSNIEDHGCRTGQCPSELELDQYHLEELGPIEAAAIRRSVESCSGCEARLGIISAGFSAFPELDADALGARILDGFEGELPAALSAGTGSPVTTEKDLSLFDRVMWWLGRPAARGAFIIAAAVLVTQVMQPDVGQVVEQPAVRMKGNIALTIHRFRGENVDVVASGDQFKSGDRLRFEVTTPRIGHLLIVGKEKDGQTYLVYPLDTKGKAALKQPGRDALRGSVALDGSTGTEMLYAIFCHRTFMQADIALNGESPQTPKDCYVTEFELNKVP